MSRLGGFLVAILLLGSNNAASSREQPPSSCTGALANTQVYAAVLEAAQTTVSRLEGREVTFRDVLHELHNNVLNVSRNNLVVQNNINKFRAQLFDAFTKQTTSRLGDQIKACYPMLEELLHARERAERAAEQRKQEEEEDKKADPSSCLGALVGEPNSVVMNAEAYNPEGPKSARQIVARLQNPKLQAIAKGTIDTLENSLATAGNLSRTGFAEQFRMALGAKLANEREKSGKMLFSEEFGWTQGMTPDQQFACFPDLAAMAHRYEARVEAAQEAARRREQEEAERQAELGKIPRVVLGTAYLAYVDVKRCYEARESYAMQYITYDEMELAKSAVRQIEDAMRPNLGTSTDDVWASYIKDEDPQFEPHRDYAEGDRRRCGERFNWLLKILHQKVPESRTIQKDF